jgi:hypothetical protein
MKVTIRILAVVLALLSAAAGAAKVALVPEEVEFLNGLGFSEVAIFVFGGIQIVGGLLLLVPRFAVAGSVPVLLAFTLSAVLLFLDGNVVFAGISVVPAALTAFVVFHLKTKSRESTKENAWLPVESISLRGPVAKPHLPLGTLIKPICTHG